MVSKYIVQYDCGVVVAFTFSVTAQTDITFEKCPGCVCVCLFRNEQVPDLFYSSSSFRFRARAVASATVRAGGFLRALVPASATDVEKQEL